MKPILFNADMSRALRDGMKTQTRRLSPLHEKDDLLWVRENFHMDSQMDNVSPAKMSKYEPVYYPSDNMVREMSCSMIKPGKCRPSIHMPKWASRTTLEVIDVRCEPLLDISEEDAKAEGVQRLDKWDGDFDFDDFDKSVCRTCGGARLFDQASMMGIYPDKDCDYCDTYKKRFINLWYSIYGEGHGNPLVWVYEFSVWDCNFAHMNSDTRCIASPQIKIEKE